MAAADTAGQISTSIVQITAHLGAMAGLSEQARVLAQEGRAVVGRATNEMGHIAVLVSESTLVLQTLGEHSQQISKIELRALLGPFFIDQARFVQPS